MNYLIPYERDMNLSWGIVCNRVWVLRDDDDGGDGDGDGDEINRLFSSSVKKQDMKRGVRDEVDLIGICSWFFFIEAIDLTDSVGECRKMKWKCHTVSESNSIKLNKTLKVSISHHDTDPVAARHTVGKMIPSVPTTR